MDKVKEDGSWEVKDNRVKVGTSWKTLQQVQVNLILESLFSIVFVLGSVWAFHKNIFFGLLCLAVGVFFCLAATGSYNAMKALDAKLKLGDGIKAKAKDIQQKAKSSKEKVISKFDTEKMDVEATFLVTLGKTSSDERQSIISDLVVDGILHVSEEYVVTTKSGLVVGELTKIQQDKVKGIASDKLQCKVVQIAENKSKKKIVRAELIVLK